MANGVPVGLRLAGSCGSRSAYAHLSSAEATRTGRRRAIGIGRARGCREAGIDPGLDHLSLRHRWGQVGGVELVGAVARGLVVSRDIAFEGFTCGEPTIAAGFPAAGSRRTAYWPGRGRSLKIRMPRYLFIHSCLCG